MTEQPGAAAKLLNVALRLRPLPAGSATAPLLLDANTHTLYVQDVAGPFKFDNVCTVSVQNEQVYQTCVAPLVDCFLRTGRNATVLATGSHASGKTWTMGIPGQPEAQAGVVPRTLEHIFAALPPQGTWQQPLVEVTILEVHNERMRDLLAARAASGMPAPPMVLEGPNGSVCLQGAAARRVTSYREAVQAWSDGWAARTALQLSNGHSVGLSHMVFSLTITDILPGNVMGATRKLHLVECATPLEANAAVAIGVSMQETVTTARSLSVLHRVLQAVGKESFQMEAPPPPYADTQLTRLLRDSITSMSAVCVLACIGCEAAHLQATLQTLKSASDTVISPAAATPPTASSIVNRLLALLDHATAVGPATPDGKPSKEAEGLKREAVALLSKLQPEQVWEAMLAAAAQAGPRAGQAPLLMPSPSPARRSKSSNKGDGASGQPDETTPMKYLGVPAHMHPLQAAAWSPHDSPVINYRRIAMRASRMMHVKSVFSKASPSKAGPEDAGAAAPAQEAKRHGTPAKQHPGAAAGGRGGTPAKQQQHGTPGKAAHGTPGRAGRVRRASLLQHVVHAQAAQHAHPAAEGKLLGATAPPKRRDSSWGSPESVATVGYTASPTSTISYADSPQALPSPADSLAGAYEGSPDREVPDAADFGSVTSGYAPGAVPAAAASRPLAGVIQASKLGGASAVQAGAAQFKPAGHPAVMKLAGSQLAPNGAMIGHAM